MKTVTMTGDHDYVPPADERITVSYKAGVTYKRVPEAHADAIVLVGAGYIVGDDQETIRDRRR